MLKNEGFPTFLQIGSLELADFWSLDEVVGDLRSHVCPYVRASVRPYVRHAFSRKPFITFF